MFQLKLKHEISICLFSPSQLSSRQKCHLVANVSDALPGFYFLVPRNSLHNLLRPSTKENPSERIRRPSSHRRRIRSIADGSGDAIKQPTGPSGYRQKNGNRWLGARKNSFTFTPIVRWPFSFSAVLFKPTTKFTQMTKLFHWKWNYNLKKNLCNFRLKINFLVGSSFNLLNLF